MQFFRGCDNLLSGNKWLLSTKLFWILCTLKSVWVDLLVLLFKIKLLKVLIRRVFKIESFELSCKIWAKAPLHKRRTNSRSMEDVGFLEDISWKTWSPGRRLDFDTIIFFHFLTHDDYWRSITWKVLMWSRSYCEAQLSRQAADAFSKTIPQWPAVNIILLLDLNHKKLTVLWKSEFIIIVLKLKIWGFRFKNCTTIHWKSM